jgi:hypothetical protein
MHATSSNLNPNVVKTSLDEIFYQEWGLEMHPGYVDQSSGRVFKQDTTDRAAEIVEIFKGVTTWNSREEEEDVEVESTRSDNKKTFTVNNYDKAISIPKIFFDDQMHGFWENTVRDFARKGRVSQKKESFAIYRGAFDTYVTADGSYVVANDHTTINGDTVDNKMTSALSPSSLKTAIQKMVEQKDQAGVILGNMPETLLVPPALHDYACEVTKSELKADTTDNNMNPYSTEYNLYVSTSEWLGSAAGGSDTAWFLLGRNHSVTRWVRESIWTSLVDYVYTTNNSYKYKGGFREMVGAPDYVGIMGSTGAS